MTDPSPRVGLFVTCLVDMMRPSVGFAAVKLLEDAGCTVEVPETQTCCGQPAFNSGAKATAADLARNVSTAFKGFDYVVVPSGSCGGMIIKHYPELLPEESADEQLTEKIFKKCQQDRITNFHGTPSSFRSFLDEASAFFDKKSIREICPSAEVLFHRGIPLAAQMEQGVLLWPYRH